MKYPKGDARHNTPEHPVSKFFKMYLWPEGYKNRAERRKAERFAVNVARRALRKKLQRRAGGKA